MASAATIILYHSFFLLFFFFFFFSSATVLEGQPLKNSAISPQSNLLHLSQEKEMVKEKNYGRRLLIGSMAPVCTYNECRGCKMYTKKCWAEQVPVEGNDPINSSYRYKCVCHR